MNKAKEFLIESYRAAPDREAALKALRQYKDNLALLLNPPYRPLGFLEKQYLRTMDKKSEKP